MVARIRQRTRERLHPATPGCVLLLFVSVGRLPELVPPLGMLQLGNVAVALAVIGLLIGLRHDPVPVFRTTMGRLVLAFAALVALSVGYSIWTMESLEAFINVIKTVVLFYIVARTATTPRMLRIYAAALAACAAMLALATVIGHTAGRAEVARAAYDPNDLALVLITLLPIVTAGILARGGFRRWVLVSIAVLMLITILLTGSRGGLLGLIAVAGYLLFARFPRVAVRRQPRRLGPAKLFVVGVGTLLLLVTMPQFTWQRLESLTHLESDYNLTSPRGRLAVWGRGLDAFSERPWGYGVGTYAAVDGGQGGQWQAPHNIWLQVAVELGVLGFFIYVALFWTAWRTVGQLSQRVFDKIDLDDQPPPPGWVQIGSLSVALKGSLIGFLVSGFFLSAAYFGVLFALFALIAGLERQAHALEAGEGVPSIGGTDIGSGWRGMGTHDRATHARHGGRNGRSWTT